MADVINVIVSTTGTAGTVFLPDLDNLELVHPTTLNLTDMFALDALSDSEDLQAAIIAAQLTITDEEGKAVTQVKKLEFRSNQNAWQVVFGRNARNAATQYLRHVDGIRSDRAPVYIPLNAFITTIACSNGNVASDYEIQISVSPTSPNTGFVQEVSIPCTTFATTAQFGEALPVSAGSWLAVRLVVTGNPRPDYPAVYVMFVEQ